MKISKSIKKRKGDSVNFLEQLEEIIERLLAFGKSEYQDAQLDSFGLTVSLPYEDITYDTYDEFKNNWKDIDLPLINYFQGSIYIKEDSKSYKKILYFYFSFFRDNQYVELSIRTDEQDFLKKSFSEITQSLSKFKILEYNPRSDQLQQRENVVSRTISILKNFNRYQLRLKSSLKDEKELQGFLFPILKSHFLDLEEEFNLPQFGAIAYKPDFGFPSAKLLLECKYLRGKRDIKHIQKEIHDDAIGYLKASSNNYKSLIVFIYNNKNTPIPDKFPRDLKKISGIDDVIIVPGVDPK